MNLFLQRVLWSLLLVPRFALILLRGAALLFVLATGVKVDYLDVSEELSFPSFPVSSPTGVIEYEYQSSSPLYAPYGTRLLLDGTEIGSLAALETADVVIDRNGDVVKNRYGHTTGCGKVPFGGAIVTKDEFTDADIRDLRDAWAGLGTGILAGSSRPISKAVYEFSDGVFTVNGQEIGRGSVAIAGSFDATEELAAQARAEYAVRSFEALNARINSILDSWAIDALAGQSEPSVDSLMIRETLPYRPTFLEEMAAVSELNEGFANDAVLVFSTNGLLKVPVIVSIETVTGAGEQYVTRSLDNTITGYGRNVQESKYHFHQQYKEALDAANAEKGTTSDALLIIDGLHVPVTLDYDQGSGMYFVGSVEYPEIHAEGPVLHDSLSEFKRLFGEQYEVVEV